MDLDVFPNSVDYWGPNGMVFFRNVQLRWMPCAGDTRARLRAGAAGRERRPAACTPTASSSRTSACASRLPDLSAHYRHGGRLGPRAGRGHPALHQAGRPEGAPVRPLRATRLGWGVNAQHQPEARRKARLARPGRVRRGHPELHERRAGGHRLENNFDNPTTPVKRRRFRSWASSRSSTSTGTPSATSSVGYSTLEIDNTRRPGHGRLQERPVRARQPAVLPGPEHADRRRGAVGPPREILATASTPDDFRVQFSVKYSFARQIRRGVMTMRTPCMRRRLLAAAVAARGAGRRRGPRSTPAAASRPRSTRPMRKYKDLKEGKNADYIPALAKVDPNIFGIALVTADGQVYTAGDVKIRGVDPVDLQGLHDGARSSRSRAGGDRQARSAWTRPGMRFNSIVVDRAVRRAGGPEMNSLVNPGAIATTSMVTGATARRDLEQDPRATTATSPAAPLSVNQEVFKSEADTNQRNQAIGAPDVRLRLHQGEPRCRRPTSTPSSAR